MLRKYRLKRAITRRQKRKFTIRLIKRCSYFSPNKKIIIYVNMQYYYVNMQPNNVDMQGHKLISFHACQHNHCANIIIIYGKITSTKMTKLEKAVFLWNCNR